MGRIIPSTAQLVSHVACTSRRIEIVFLLRRCPRKRRINEASQFADASRGGEL
jgi:hypothetical protein